MKALDFPLDVVGMRPKLSNLVLRSDDKLAAKKTVLVSKLRPAEILGVSHLVLGVRDILAAELFLARYDYTKHDEIESASNPPAKSPFVAGFLAPTFAMKLMVSTIGSPSIELLREDIEYAYETFEDGPIFEAVWGTDMDLEPRQVLNTLECEETDPFDGFRKVESCTRVSRIVALFIHCQDLRTALPIWQALGFKQSPIGSGIAQVKIQGPTASSRLDVYFIAHRSRPTTGYLDRTGIVCLSLFCKDADHLRLVLSEMGYFVSDCFTLAPFKRPLRIFFARNASGETYEFLSIVRSKYPDG